MFEVKVIADSIGERHDIRLTTLQLKYPRFIHAEFMTHRVFSRNASSSRAIPVEKMLKQVREEPAMPIHWGRNQPGMQAEQEHDAMIHTGMEAYTPKEWWHKAAESAADMAEAMMNAGYHKQVVNRLLEPFQHINVVVSATDWLNFFELRCHPDAQPEIRHLAQMMMSAMDTSVPVRRSVHLPYVHDSEWRDHPQGWGYGAQLSAARCARVSYNKHDGTAPDAESDLKLYDRLVGSKPIHASPTEHPAIEAVSLNGYANFRGWRQLRQCIEDTHDYDR